MASINTHDLKINGLKKASGETKNYGYYSGKYVEIFYDKGTGEVLTKFQYSLGQNTWTEYHDSNIIKVCNASMHMTMQEIADKIAERIDEVKAYED